MRVNVYDPAGPLVDRLRDAVVLQQMRDQLREKGRVAHANAHRHGSTIPVLRDTGTTRTSGNGAPMASGRQYPVEGSRLRAPNPKKKPRGGGSPRAGGPRRSVPPTREVLKGGRETRPPFSSSRAAREI